VSVLPGPAVKLHNLEVAEDPKFDSAPFLKLETGRLALKLGGLLAGRVEFGDLTLLRPAITLIRNPEGVLNIASLGAAAEPKKSPGRGGQPSVGPTPAIGGPVKGTFNVTGTLGAPKAAGTLELASARVTEEVAACPEPRRRTLTLTALKLGGTSWDGGRLTSRPVTTSLAGGKVSLNLGATLDGGVRVADLFINGLPLERVLGDFLCQAYAVSGP